MSQTLHGAGLVQRILRRCCRRLRSLVGLGHDHRLRPQCRGLEHDSHAGRHHRLEGAHSVAGGAGAAADRWLWVGSGPQHDAMDRAEGLAGAGRCGTPTAAAGVLPLLQGVQHHIGGVFGRALAFQLAELVQSSVHRFFYVLPEAKRVCVREEGQNELVAVKKVGIEKEKEDTQEKAESL